MITKPESLNSVPFGPRRLMEVSKWHYAVAAEIKERGYPAAREYVDQEYPTLSARSRYNSARRMVKQVRATELPSRHYEVRDGVVYGWMFFATHSLDQMQMSPMFDSTSDLYAAVIIANG